MAKTTLDQVLEVLEVVNRLNDTAEKHAQAIGKIIDRLTGLRSRSTCRPDKPAVTGGTPSRWPKGVEPIGFEGLRRLGIDGGNRLFWHGRRVEVRSSLSLTGFQKAITAIVTLCSLLGALGGFVTGFDNATVFLCARRLDWLTCPSPQATDAPQAAASKLQTTKPP